MRRTRLENMWHRGARTCVLDRYEGRLELKLCDGDRTVRMTTCVDEHEARRIAGEWLAAESPEQVH
jgi:hypothetical protein